ncbi:sterol desaturase [Acidocella aquatica]|uniref:Sterol desaturase n=1 Tax=Acidocella aquatica TaxID=1922313 RepID=A0ABQ6AC65_9PROT|nr:sterol desaturase family protein [Acidocella aquatica]GLR68197.1 sterol desaturase [Acidocella aquatica]
MAQFLLTHGPTLRLVVSFGLLAVLAAAEAWRPRRMRSLTRGQRWPGNLGIAVADALAVKLLFPLAAFGVAVFAAQRGWGGLNLWNIPEWLKIVLALLGLDLTIYLQHVLFHAVPVLWRLHRMHHTDLDLDVTSGARFHPIEIILSMGIKLAAVVALGAPAVSVLLFEIILNATAMFNHSNLALPLGVDRTLRLLVVTPDMHRVHHSVIPAETNSNFGFNIPWWDRLLGTYRAQPAAGHEGMSIGLAAFRDPAATSRFDAMLVQPFSGPAGATSLEAGQSDT